MNNSTRTHIIRSVLQSTFSPSFLEIKDESQLHQNHEGAKTGKGHFYVSMISESFKGKTSVKCHQLVYEALASLIESDIHALRLKLKAPD